MKYLEIGQKRMLHIIEYDIRKSALGTLDWFVDVDGYLNILLHVRGVDYVYKEMVYSRDDLHPELLAYITLQYEVLGTYDFEKDELEMPEEVTVEEYMRNIARS